VDAFPESGAMNEQFDDEPFSVYFASRYRIGANASGTTIGAANAYDS
jgi:hypothetical protein